MSQPNNFTDPSLLTALLSARERYESSVAQAADVLALDDQDFQALLLAEQREQQQSAFSALQTASSSIDWPSLDPQLQSAAEVLQQRETEQSAEREARQQGLNNIIRRASALAISASSKQAVKQLAALKNTELDAEFAHVEAVLHADRESFAQSEALVALASQAWPVPNLLHLTPTEEVVSETAPADETVAAPETATDEIVVVEPAAKDAAPIEPDTHEASITSEAQEPTKIFKAEKLPGLSMTNDELAVVQKIINGLSETAERMAFKDICMLAYGRPRLARKDEARLLELMGGYADLGVLRAYGKQFGYRTDAERIVMDAEKPAQHYEHDPLLTDAERSLHSHLKKLVEITTPEINIGHFVRTYFNRNQVVGADYHDTIDSLNNLASRGYLLHAERSPWYALGSREMQPIELEPVIVEPLAVDIIAPLVELTLTPTEIEAPTIEEPKPAEELTELKVEIPRYPDVYLTERERAMYDALIASIEPGVWFQKAAVDLSGVTFPSDSALSQAFSQFTAKLVSAGALEATGIRGGRKYQLPAATKAPSTVPEAAAVEKPEVAAIYVEPPIEKIAAPTTIKPEKAVKIAQVVLPKMVAPEPVKAPEGSAEFDAAFEQKVDLTIENWLKINDAKDYRLKVIVEHLAYAMGVDEEIARSWISNRVEAGTFHYVSVRKNRHLAIGPNLEPKQTKAKAAKASPRELVSAWTPHDTEVAFRVFKSLIGFRHVQQGHKIEDLVRLVTQDGEKEDIIRRAIRKAANNGYLEIKQGANLNTRSDHSKRIESTVVRFASQKLKERFKNEPGALRAELDTLIVSQA